MLKQLKEWLGGAKKVVIVGIGSTQRGDDGVGPVVIHMLERYKLPRSVETLDCGETPENFSGVLKKMKPTHIIMIDAAEQGLEHGMMRLHSLDDVGGASVSTHALPLSMLAKYLSHYTNAKMLLIAIQPHTLEFNQGLGKECTKTARRLCKMLKEALQKEP